MISLELFLGIEITPKLEAMLTKSPPPLVSTLTSGNEYLERRKLNGSNFIGKTLRYDQSLNSIILAENHVYSILKQIFPSLTLEEMSLKLITLTLANAPI